MSVALRPGPDRRYWYQMGKIQRRDDGLAHVGVGIARHRRQPRLHRIESFRDGHEAPALDYTLHPAQLLVGQGSVSIEHHHGGGDKTEGDLVASQLLQSGIRVGRLVAGVGVDQRALLLEEGFAQQRQDVLALGEPLAAQTAKFLFRLGLVHAEEACAPAIGEAQPVEVIQNPRPGRGRETTYRRHAQVRVAQHRRQAAEQRSISQQRVEVERYFRRVDAVASRRNGRVQVGQRFVVIEPVELRHHAHEQIEDAFDLRDKGREALAPVHAGGRRVLVQQPGRAGMRLLRRQVLQREVVTALEVLAGLLERSPSLLVHQPRQRFGEVRVRVICRRPTLGLDEQRPARAEPTQRVVQPRGGGHQLPLRGAVQVRPTKAPRALERAVLVQHHAGRHQAGPR